MIRSEDVRKELKILDDAIAKDTSTLSNVVKAITLVIKVMLDVRSNTVAIMKKIGAELRTKPEGRDSEDKPEDNSSTE